MRLRALLAVIVILVLWIPCATAEVAASKEGGDMAGVPGFPEDVTGWRLEKKPDRFGPETVYGYMNGGAEFFLAYRMKELAVGKFTKPGRPAITTEVYRMGSSQDAYGVFNFEQQDPPAGVGQDSEFGGGLLRFWKGSYFVSVFGEDSAPDVDAAVLNLGEQIARSIQESGDRPSLLGTLPQPEPSFATRRTWYLKSHILLNQRFFISHQNVLNLGPSVEAVLARYAKGEERIFVLLLKYPSEERANTSIAGFRRAYMPEVKGEGMVRTENGKWTSVAQRGKFVIIVFDAKDELTALGLERSISEKLGKEVS
jgi:hypothetical protein